MIPAKIIRSSRKQRQIGWRRFMTITAALCLAAFSAVWFAEGSPSTQAGDIGILITGQSRPAPAASADREQARFGLCLGSNRVNCIVDGDTFWYRGRKIRIADINTPEIGKPDCPAEARLAEQAKQRLYHLLNDAAFSLQPADRKRDRYGRELWVVTRNGRSLGDTLVDEGLAHPWRGRREPWCG